MQDVEQVTATVTSKGQITVPAEVRSRLGLSSGSRLAFIPTRDGYEIRPETASIRDLKGVLPLPRQPVELEDMDEAIAAGATRSSDSSR